MVQSHLCMFTTVSSEMAQFLQYNNPENDTEAIQCQMIMDKPQRSSQEIFFLRISSRKAGKELKASLIHFTKA